eukprot:gene799-4087_t
MHAIQILQCTAHARAFASARTCLSLTNIVTQPSVSIARLSGSIAQRTPLGDAHRPFISRNGNKSKTVSTTQSKDLISAVKFNKSLPNSFTLDNVHFALSEFERKNDAICAEKVIQLALSHEIPIDTLSFSKAIHICGRKHRLEAAQRLMDELATRTQRIPSHLQLALYRCYVAQGNLDAAQAALSLVTSRNHLTPELLADFLTVHVLAGESVSSLIDSINKWLSTLPQVAHTPAFFKAMLRNMATTASMNDYTAFATWMTDTVADTSIHDMVEPEDVLIITLEAQARHGLVSDALLTASALEGSDPSVSRRLLRAVARAFVNAHRVGEICDRIAPLAEAHSVPLDAYFHRFTINTILQTNDAPSRDSNSTGWTASINDALDYIESVLASHIDAAPSVDTNNNVGDGQISLRNHAQEVAEGEIKDAVITLLTHILNQRNWVATNRLFDILERFDVCLLPAARVTLKNVRQTNAAQLANRSLTLLAKQGQALETHYKAALHTACKAGHTQRAKDLGAHLKSLEALSVTDHMRLMDCFAQAGLPDETERTLKDLEQLDFVDRSGRVTSNTIRAAINAGQTERALKMLDEMGDSAMHMLRLLVARQFAWDGDLDRAREQVDLLVQRNVLTSEAAHQKMLHFKLVSAVACHDASAALQHLKDLGKDATISQVLFAMTSCRSPQRKQKGRHHSRNSYTSNDTNNNDNGSFEPDSQIQDDSQDNLLLRTNVSEIFDSMESFAITNGLSLNHKARANIQRMRKQLA